MKFSNDFTPINRFASHWNIKIQKKVLTISILNNITILATKNADEMIVV